MPQNIEVISYESPQTRPRDLLLLKEDEAHDLVLAVGNAFPMTGDWSDYCKSVCRGQVLLFDIISATQAACRSIDLSEVPGLIRNMDELLTLSEDAGKFEETRLWCAITEFLHSTDDGMFYDTDSFLRQFEPLAAGIEAFISQNA